MTTKRCCTCKQPKTLADFNKNSSQPDGLDTRCKLCNQRKSRRAVVKHRYGLEFSAALELADQPCMLCGTTESTGRGRRHVDHCHDTGAVRGALCAPCNTALGHVEAYLKDPSRIDYYLNRGADYRAVDQES